MSLIVPKPWACAAAFTRSTTVGTSRVGPMPNPISSMLMHYLRGSRSWVVATGPVVQAQRQSQVPWAGQTGPDARKSRRGTAQVYRKVHRAGPRAAPNHDGRAGQTGPDAR